jgi:hypothetical protein
MLSEEIFMDVIRSGVRMKQLKEIDTPNGFEVFVESSWFTQDEKDYVLFNIEKIKKLAEINPYHLFENNGLRK